MRIIVIGATGTIGSQVVQALAREHQIVRVGRRHGDFQVDIASRASLVQLFGRLGSFDAVICTAGEARAGHLAELTDADFMLGLTSKLMGQVNVVRIGCQYIRNNGSFTLTSGVLSQEPVSGTAAISMVNAAVEAFVRAAALDLDRGLRINAVSPVWATETLEALGLKATPHMPAAQFVPAYRESVEGHRTGEVLDVRDFVREPVASEGLLY
jgi:NAD(P)-dependent dehydrogenase (short-subunit alcohol dehydrogenase family)